MGIFTGLVAAVTQATHTLAKGTDEAVQQGGGLGFIGIATASIAEMTGRLNASAQDAHETGTSISSGGTPSSGFFSNAKQAVFGSNSEPAKTETVKLGRSAQYYNGTVTSPAVQDPYHADFNSIQVPQVQNLVSVQQASVTV